MSEFDDVAATRMAYDLLPDENRPGVNIASFRDDHKLHVRFSVDSVLDIAESRKQQRHVYKDVTFVRIQVPGDDKNIIHEPLLTEPEVVGNPRHQKNYAVRFPKQYDQFKRGEEQSDSGTPLIKWPRIHKAQVLELSHVGVKTVEQLAAMSDALIQKGGLGWQNLKQLAQDWILQTQDSKHVEKLRDELGARDREFERLQKENAAQMAKMQEQLAELTAALAGKADAKAKVK